MAHSEVKLEYFPWQLEVRKAVMGGAKSLALACAARCGKDVVSNNLAIEWPYDRVLTGGNVGLIPRVNVWVVAPTRALYHQHWDEFRAKIPNELVVRHNRQDGELRLRGDIRIAFKSADHPETLVSEGVDMLIVTEASRIKSNLAWEESMAPRLVSPGRAGIALINGSPRVGRGHWFRRFFEKTAEARWNLPTMANPLITPAAIERLRRTMPDRLFRSEVLGEWPDDDEMPFRASDVARMAVRGGSVSGRQVGAVDPARTVDETFCVRGWGGVEVTEHGMRRPEVTGVLRLRGLRLSEQVDRVARFMTGVSAVVVDASAEGGKYFADELAATGLTVVPQTFQGGRKEDLVDALIAAVEKGAIGIRTDMVADRDWGELKWQLENFEAEVQDDGSVQYHGPGGHRDDGVMALAMWWSRARRLVGGRDFDMAGYLMSMW